MTRDSALNTRRLGVIMVASSVLLLVSILFTGGVLPTNHAHADAPPFYEWSAQSLPHVIGYNSGDGRLITTADCQPTGPGCLGYLQYGPYTTSLGAGTYTVTWYLMVDNTTANDNQIVQLDVNDFTQAPVGGNDVLASRILTRHDWTGAFGYQPFSLTFSLPSGNANPNDALEFRVYSYGTSYVRELKVRVGTPPAIQDSRTFTPGTLADYWNGNAHWDLWQTLTASNNNGTSSLFDGTALKVISNGTTDTWYLFNRKWNYTATPCPDGEIPLGTQVRESTNQGQTWSSPVDIIVPTAGTPWSCVATDGDAYYNSAQNKWYYLAQCWVGAAQGPHYDNLCEFERNGSDPMGMFTPHSTTTPVIQDGQLWSQICNNSPAGDCGRYESPGGHIGAEGTIDIFKYDGTDYWLAFHGEYPINPPTSPYFYAGGLRGIAKTSDLSDGSKYVVEDTAQGVPDDAILTANDANQPSPNNWREQWFTGDPSTGDPAGSIGAGAGSIVEENGYYYLLAEFADISLNCTNNQNWDLGLFRSSSLTNTHWDQFPQGNPIVYSSHAPEGAGPVEGQWGPCNVQYGHLFQDPTTGITYMMYGRRSPDPDYDGIYFYRLDKTTNLLTNGDLWRADTSSWNTFGGSETSISAPRLPNQSPDGTPFMLMQCSANCSTSDHSVYQDVAVPANSQGQTFTFGGQFATGWGTGDSTGNIILKVWQLDANQNVVDHTQVGATLGGTYTPQSGQVTIDANTTTLRFQVYLENTIPFRADNMYIEPA